VVVVFRLRVLVRLLAWVALLLLLLILTLTRSARHGSSCCSSVKRILSGTLA
jgi:hypothetical protein